MKTAEPARLPAWVPLAVLTALGALLRLRGLGEGLWYDEAVTWRLAHVPMAELLTGSERWPHVYVLARLGMRLFGEGELWLRLPFVLYGVACIPVIYRAARAVLDEDAALFAASLMAFGAVPVEYSREARYYAPLLFYACWALWTLAEARRESLAGRGAPRWWAAFALGQVLGLLAHPSAVGVLALSSLGIAGRAAALFARGRRREAARWAAHGGGAFLALAAALAAIPWTRWHLPSSASVYLGAGPTWVASFARDADPGYRLLGRLARYLLAGDEGAAWPLTALLGALAAWGAYAVRVDRRGPLLFAAAWIALPIAAAHMLRVKVPLTLRYFVFLLPVVQFILARGAATALSSLAPSLSQAKRRLVLVAAAAALSAPALARLEQAPPSGWREALAHIGRASSVADAVVVLPWMQQVLVSYYGLERTRTVHALYPPGSGSAPFFNRLGPGGRFIHPLDLEEALGGSPRVWVAAPRNVGRWERKEEERLLLALEPGYALKELRELPGRNPVAVYLLERRAGVATGAPRRAAPRGRALARPVWYFGSVPELLERLPVSGRGYTLTVMGGDGAGPSISTNLIRLRAGSAPLPASARGRELFYVWSGSGTLSARGASLAFIPGDVVDADCRGGCRAHARPGGAVLVAIRGGEAEAGAPPLRALGNARAGGAPGCASLLAQAGPLEVRVQRVVPGAECRVDGPFSGASLLLEGKLWDGLSYASIGDAHQPSHLYHMSGDLYVLSLRPGDVLRSVLYSDIWTGEAVRLLVGLKRAPR